MDLFEKFDFLLGAEENDMWNQLQDLAQMPGVYACALSPFDKKDKQLVYVYILNKQAVFLLLDRNKAAIDELADEDSFTGEANAEPLYFSSSSHRVSPVFYLWQVMQLYNRWQAKGEVEMLEIRGVMFTNVHIINAEDVESIWGCANIRVSHDLDNLPYRLPCNYAASNALQRFLVSYKQIEMPSPRDYYKALTTNVGGRAETITITWDDLIDSEDSDFVEVTYANGEVFRNKKLPAATLLSPLPNPMETLNSLIGLEAVKNYLKKLTALAEYRKKMVLHFPDTVLPPMNLHALFLGNVGVGKSSVAQLYSSLLHELGFLSKGHTLLCSRPTFVGKYYGDEEKNVRKILKAASGGTVVIDEAYTLCTPDERDPAHRVLELFLEALSDETKRDLCVILCGYEKPMKRLISSNPGLASRFPNVFLFQDFSLDELHEIAWRRMVEDNSYTFTDEGWRCFMTRIERMYKYRTENFGNAREVANLCEQVILQHAVRCVEEKVEDPKRLFEITASDVNSISSVDKSLVQPERKIGFR